MTGDRRNLAPLAFLLSFLGLMALSDAGIAGETKVAVAANFTATVKQIAARFELKTGHKAVLIFGSTGKLYAQIYNAAPFDVFLAADSKRPQRAESEGLAVSGTRFTYATGKIVLYSTNPTLINGTSEVLLSKQYNKLAIGNPKTAPYGLAAMEVLKKLGIHDKVKSKIVRGDNIAQTHQFVMTGNAQLGFVARSQVINDKSGSRWQVPDNLYSPIRQDAVLLKHGADNAAAQAFLAFLKGDIAHDIIKQYGYGLE